MTWQTTIGILAGLGLAFLLVRQLLAASARRAAEPDILFGQAQNILENPRLESTGTVGVLRLLGEWNGLPVQVQTVVDTLAVRKLPSLWLMVTIPEPLPLHSTFDLMMRAAGPTSFSNFDLLPHAVLVPSGFPEHAAIRTDDPAHLLPAHVIAPHLGAFDNPRMKELLISPKGLRLVKQMAEADRARYGVFRQADFGAAVLEASTLQDMLVRLAAIRRAILDWNARNA
jgi:hypothetical protein